jgi:hypothetical protein
LLSDDYKHVVSKAKDRFGETFYYCHMKAFPSMPVFGSIGSYQKAKAVADQFNAAYKEKKDV